MRRSREETAPQDLPGDLWHALAQLHRTHPDPVGRVGPLACPAGLLSFAAADDTVLAARVQLSGAESMREVNETLRSTATVFLVMVYRVLVVCGRVVCSGWCGLGVVVDVARSTSAGCGRPKPAAGG
ncbi:hypothetical protein ACFUJU_29125 [Streptomyces sp. NPDC057235]|uniref:hypothetical protein n=1 Tax=Streptomyces sp. NPDC057235 TaxID=3346058 RepID=UPI003634B307